MRGLIPVLGGSPYGAIFGAGGAGGGDSTLTIVLPLVTSAQTIFEPTVIPDTTQIVELDLVTSTQTIFDPTITVGSVNVVLPLVSSGQTIFELTISQTGTIGSVLLESGDDLLLETGDFWLVESGDASKVTAMTNNTSPVGTDLLPMVDDPAGTPISKKMTLTTLLAYLVA